MEKEKVISAVKGMKDILPSEALIWQRVEAKAHEIFQRYNYQEIRTPIAERTELFSRSIGDTTDIVEKEMFTFKDKNDESMTLRPEGTASVVRSCIENNLVIPGHLSKLYYIGPMFRYEKPQKGRQRQFHQLGAEALGLDDPLIDAELIDLCQQLLIEVGLRDFSVEINSLGCGDCRKDFKNKLIKFLNSNEKDLCKNCIERKDKNPLRIFDCKEESCKALVAKAPKIIDYLCEDCKIHFEGLKKGLTSLDINFNINPNIVRGLDYYTKTVFEFTSGKLGAQNSILGGGRYNSLFEELGGNPTPSSGFALGIERLVIAIADQIKDQKEKALVYIASIGEKAKSKSFEIASTLRKINLKTEIEFADKGLKWELSRADKLQASFVIIVGDNEIANNSYIIRNMKTKEQIESKIEELAQVLKSLIEENK